MDSSIFQRRPPWPQSLHQFLPPDDAGYTHADEHPLLMRDLALARHYFERVEFTPFVLFSILATPLRNSRVFPSLLSFLESVEAWTFKVALMRRYAWTSVWIMEGPRVSQL